MHDNEDVYSKYLGKKSDYIDTYTPSLLEPVPRVLGREKIGLMDDTLPFDGFDLWTAFELSWLNQKGKPMVGMAEFKIPAQSKNLIESKSLKLYLNSLNQSHFDSSEALQSVLSKDLSNAAVGAVYITVSEGMKNDDLHIHHPKAVNIDDIDIDIDIDIEVHDYRFNEEYLKEATQETAPFVSETLMSHLLKSNCLVTHQPDRGSVFIKYEGHPIDKEKLLRYIISFRQHHEFHEQCVERIFMDIKKYCRPEKLTVFARYTRRGGLDINPFRSDYESSSNVGRLIRQ